MSPWVYDPHYGGNKIPPRVQAQTRARILAHAQKQYAGRYTRLDIRFRGQFCYIDAYKEPAVPADYQPVTNESREEFIERLRNTPIHLVRLRYFREDHWSLAFYTYSNERYEPCVFHSGQDMGTPEEALDVGSVYLTD